MKLDPQLDKVLTALCEDIATPRSLAVKLLYDACEWTQLQQLRCSPCSYTTGETYFKDVFITDLLRKCQLPGDRSYLDAEAVRTFWDCESQCAMTNARLQRFLPDTSYFYDSGDLAISSLIADARGIVARVLGRVPDDLTPRFGQGATVSDKVPLITKPDKLSKRPTVTPDASYLKPLWLDTAWARSLHERGVDSDLQEVRGNVFFTVPKDSTKNRGCCKEPSFNVSYQLSLGRLIKTKLLAHGIDLFNGQALHRRLAQRASVDGRLCTLDLSNASDTIARVLVRLLLPSDWFQLLDDLRSHFTLIEGKWKYLEKFSSMGNGFTFELETLIFFAITKALCDRNQIEDTFVSCYGDDIIAPTSIAADLMAALRWFGFTPNDKKSFVVGPFRESCGGDFFEGVPVRAHYLEKLPSQPSDWISLANGLKRVCFYDGDFRHRWKYAHRAWRLCLHSLPSDIRRCRGPRHLGDVVIHDETFLTTVDHNGTPYVRAWVPIPVSLKWDHWAPGVQMASALLGLDSKGVNPRGEVEGWRFAKIPSWGISATLV